LWKKNDRQNVYETSSDSTSIESLFPSSGVVIKDLFELYKANESGVEKNTAIINYK